MVFSPRARDALTAPLCGLTAFALYLRTLYAWDRGVFGRKAGSAQGYDYSGAVKKSKIIWNERTLDRWLANPEALIPGQKMGFMVPEQRDRADLIEYLRSAR